MNRFCGSHVDFSDVRVYGENLYYPLFAIRRMGRTIRVRRSGRGGSFLPLFVVDCALSPE